MDKNFSSPEYGVTVSINQKYVQCLKQELNPLDSLCNNGTVTWNKLSK